MSAFPHSVAVVVGIDRYRHGIPELENARNDARELGRILEREHGYRVLALTENVTRGRILELLDRLEQEVGEGDRLLFYFAGHGLAEDSEQGLAGYLVPEDARQGVGKTDNLLAMDVLRQRLGELPCHHLLVVLDCCFAGAFRWSMTRDLEFFPEVVYDQLYQRFVHDPAWQVITSAAHDQKANDSLWVLGERGGERGHSPFARALLDGLEGAADLVPAGGNGLITATELFLYLRERVEGRTLEHDRRQTPGLWSLRERDKGEYVFAVPGREMELPPAPDLTAEANPYRGLKPFEAEHAEFFFGRSRLLETLVETVTRSPLTVVTGASGAGKSSLVRAGLVPAAGQWWPCWQVVGPLRPGDRPLAALAEALAASELLPPTRFPFEEVLRRKPRALLRIFGAWLERRPEACWLLIVDQLEELVTLGSDDPPERGFERLLAEALMQFPDRLRVLLTVRSDYAHRFAEGPLGARWRQGRLVVPPMSHHELRRAIVGPAAKKALRFDSEDLVHELIEEMLQMPGALPLLSFTLSELYRTYIESGRTDRTLSRRDYECIGGVAGSLHGRAEAELARLNAAARVTLRKVLLRMVGVERGEPTRRRVPRRELIYRREAENERVEKVLDQFISARLLVPDGDFVEPAHDRLISAWDRLADWARVELQTLRLQRRVTRAADDWIAAGRDPAHLWSGSRLLELRRLAGRPGGWLNRRERELLEASDRARRAVGLRVAVAAAVLLSLAALAAWWWVVEQPRRDLENLSVRLAGQVAPQRQAGHPHRALLLARRAYELDRRAGGRQSARVDQALRRALDVSMPSEILYRSPRPGQEPLLEFSPAEPLLAAAIGSEIVLIDVEAGTESALPLEPEAGDVSALAFGHGGRTLVSAQRQGLLRLWRQAAGPPGRWSSTPAAPAPPAAVVDLAFVPAGDDLITLEEAPEGSRIRFWRIAASAAGELVLRARPEAVHRQAALLAAIAIDPQGSTLVAAGSLSRTLSLWPLSSFPEGLREVLLPEGFSPSSLTISEDGQFLFAGSIEGGLARWRLADLDRPPLLADVLAGSELEVVGSALKVVTVPGSSLVLSAHWDGKIGWWDTKNPDYPSIISTYCDHSRSIAVSPDARFLVGGCDGIVRLWRRRDGHWSPRDTPSRRILGTEVSAIAFHPTEAGLLAVGVDDAPAVQGGVFLWHLREPEPRRLAGHAGTIETLAFDAAGAHLLAAGEGQIRLHRLTGTGPEPPPAGSWSDKLAAAFDAGGERIAAVDEAGRIGILGTASSGEVLLPKDDWAVGAVALHPGGHLVAALGDGALHVWRADPERSRESQTWIPGEPVALDGDGNVLAFSRDGHRLAAAAGSGSSSRVWLWQVGSLDRRPQTLEPPSATIEDLEFSPDGRTLAAAVTDSTVRLWSLDPAKPAVLDVTDYSEYPVGWLVDVSFSAGGETLAALDGGARSVYLWAVDTAGLADEVCRTLGRDLTAEEWQQLVGKRTSYKPICQEPSGQTESRASDH